MLINIRRSHKFITAVVIVVVIMFSSTIFFAWIFSFLDIGKPYVAKINDYTVTQIEYENALQQNTQRYISQNPANINFTTTTEFSLQTIEQLIDDELIRQYGKNIGLTISEYELGNTIINSLGGINNFNEADYLRFLNSYGLSVEAYENIIRDSLLMGRVQSLITTSITTNEDELKAYYKGVFSVYNIDTITLTPENFSQQIDASDKILEDYYNANIANYSVEESGDLVVVTTSKSNLIAQSASAMAPTDTELQNYYQQNIQKYSTPAGFVVNTLVVKSDDLVVTQSEVTAFIAAINNNGASFDTYNTFFSNTTTLETPTYNRSFTQGDIPVELTFVNSLNSGSAFFSQKDDAFYIAQLQALTEQQALNFDTIKQQVTADYEASLTQNLDPVGDLVAESNNNGGIYYLNDTYNLPLQEMNNINESTMLTFLGNNDIYAVLDAPLNDVQSFEMDDNVYFVSLVEHRPMRVKTLEEATNDGSLMGDYKEYAGAMLAKEYAETLLLSPNPNFDNPEIGIRGELTTYNLENVANLLQGDQKLVNDFINLEEGGVLNTVITNDDGSAVVVKMILSYYNPSAPSFRSFEDRARREVIAAKRSAAMDEFILSLKAKATIKINSAYKEQ